MNALSFPRQPHTVTSENENLPFDTPRSIFNLHGQLQNQEQVIRGYERPKFIPYSDSNILAIPNECNPILSW